MNQVPILWAPVSVLPWAAPQQVQPQVPLAAPWAPQSVVWLAQSSAA
ncbi:hypothetical protein [Acidovorax sp. Leaf78]|nr:hypothetical protein [Acidovorax sp. Leaf78]